MLIKIVNSFYTIFVYFFFFFQAEDGIRDFHVTGVQTCALPISRPIPSFNPLSPSRQQALVRGWLTATVLGHVGSLRARSWSAKPLSIWTPGGKIGRASCRERV